MERSYKIVVGKPEEKIPLERYNKTYLKETGCEDVDWIHLAQDRVNWKLF
jgi:hypothetical protein